MRKLWLFLVLSVAFVSAFAQNNDLEAQARQLNDEVGNAVWAVAVKNAVPLSHPTVQRVQAIFHRLQAVDSVEAQLLVAVLPIQDPPAMSLGGNRIVVQLDFVQPLSDDAIAVTLAHELGHVHMHHTEARALAVLQNARLTKTGSADELKMRVATTVMVRQLQEVSADQYGVTLATRAGFHGKAGLQEAIGDFAADASHLSGAQRVALVH